MTSTNKQHFIYPFQLRTLQKHETNTWSNPASKLQNKRGTKNKIQDQVLSLKQDLTDKPNRLPRFPSVQSVLKILE